MELDAGPSGTRPAAVRPAAVEADTRLAPGRRPQRARVIPDAPRGRPFKLHRETPTGHVLVHMRQLGVTALGPAGAMVLGGLIPSAADLAAQGLRLVGRIPAIDLYPNARLWDGRPRGTDVQQGNLANCYKMAALGAVAHRRPEAIADRVRLAAQTGAGNVEVRLWGGTARPENAYVVSTEMHVHEDSRGSRSVSGAIPRDGRMWPVAVERAIAAQHPDGYEALNHGGWMQEQARAMEQLTGEPASVVFDLRNRSLNVIRLDGSRIALNKDEIRAVHHALVVSEVLKQPAMISVDFALEPRITLSRRLNNTPEGRHAMWIEKVLPNGDALVRDQRYPDRPAVDLSFHELIRIVDGLVIGCTNGPSILDRDAHIAEMREQVSKLTIR